MKIEITLKEMDAIGAKDHSALSLEKLQNLTDFLKEEWLAENGKMRTFWNKIFDTPPKEIQVSEQDLHHAKQWESFFDQILRDILKRHKFDTSEEHAEFQLALFPEDRKDDLQIATHSAFIRNRLQFFLDYHQVFQCGFNHLKDDKHSTHAALHQLSQHAQSALNTSLKINKKMEQLVTRKIQKTFFRPFEKITHLSIAPFHGEILHLN